MAHFLQDQRISNLNLNEDALNQVNELFLSKVALLNSVSDSDKENKASISYVIKFDNKGYRVFSFADL